MKAEMLCGDLSRASSEKGARIPSTAEEDCADTRSALLRKAAD